MILLIRKRLSLLTARATRKKRLNMKIAIVILKVNLLRKKAKNSKKF